MESAKFLHHNWWELPRQRCQLEQGPRMEQSHKSTAQAQNAAFLNDPAERFISFQLAMEYYAVPILRVQEVRAPGRITPVPNTPHYVLGVISVRGTVVPTVDLRSRFNIPPLEDDLFSDCADPVALVVHVTGSQGTTRTMAVVVDALVAVRSFSSSDIVAPPKLGQSIDLEFARGMVETDTELITVLDMDRLLNSAGLELP